MEQNQLLPHLFRTEYRKIIAVLVKLLGIEHLQTAEDIAGDTFLTAFEIWGMKGLPENPVAWLYVVAKNKARNLLKHEAVFKQKVFPLLNRDEAEEGELEIDLSELNIQDSQLQMIFAVCHPAISPEAQTGLALRILCGFGIAEIADAFLTNKETINKRLLRAKEKLRAENMKIELPPADQMNERLQPVLTTLYLLFNEGYYSASQDQVLRKDLCYEAMRLTHLLIENKATNQPSVNALLALMCFQASRFDARLGNEGDIILYKDQNSALWNKELITRGEQFLKLSSAGDELSKYHLEAGIAWWHTQQADTENKWQHILHLYDQLLMIHYSPVTALNRAYALFKAEGPLAAIPAAEKLQLNDNHFYHALLGELYAGVNNALAREHFERAVSHARSAAEKKIMFRKMAEL